MPQFAAGSRAELETCHPDLQAIANEAIKYFDFKVLEGHRGPAEQHAAFLAGNSQKDWPDGKHNKTPSEAIDISPYPVDWAGTEAAHQRFVYLAGFIMLTAKKLLEAGIITHELRWGGDWNRNQDTRDEKFRDIGHFEIVPA